MLVLRVQLWAKFSADLLSAMKIPSLDAKPKRQQYAQIHRKISVCTILDSLALLMHVSTHSSRSSFVVRFSKSFFLQSWFLYGVFNAPYWEQTVSQYNFSRLAIVIIAARMPFSNEGEAVKRHLFCMPALLLHTEAHLRFWERRGKTRIIAQWFFCCCLMHTASFLFSFW